MEALLIGLAILMLLMVLGTPVAMAFGAMVIFMATWFGLDTAIMVPSAFYKIKSITLLAMLFYIFVGGLMSTSGMATRLLNFVDVFVGRFRGGLGAVSVVAAAMFGSIAGTCSAAAAGIGTIMIPKMEEHGYSRGYSTALIACSSILGQLIPPSVPMILFALVTYQSVAACWLTTVGPGIMMVIIYVIFNYFFARKMPLVLRPKLGFREHAKEAAKSTYKASLTLLLPIILFVGIYGGVTTPTEAACIGVIYVILMSLFVYRSMTVKDIGRAFIATATTNGVVVIMLFFTMIVSRILTMEKIPQQLTAWVVDTSANKYLILLLVNIFLLILGMILDDNSGTIIAAALLFPVMQTIGVHPLHFAAIVGINLGLGNITPPMAPILYLTGRIANCPIEQFIKPSLILMYGGMLPVVIVTTYWPELSLFLPRMLGFVH